MWGENISFLWEQLWVLSFLLVVGHCARSKVHDNIVAQTLPLAYFSFSFPDL